MSQGLLKNKSWWSRLARQRHESPDEIALRHGWYPEAAFREELQLQAKRATRSSNSMVVMIVDAEKLESYGADEILEALGEGLKVSIREADICGLLKGGTMLGVILTEIERPKVEKAQQVVARKFREKITSLMNEEVANQIEVTFHLLAAPSDYYGIVAETLKPDMLGPEAPEGDTLPVATMEVAQEELAEADQDIPTVKGTPS